ncbi:CbtB-domain containing protein [Actinomadura sp. GTD37]|uniref:CbtB-domain containing protein n=1 Tax=Actinomadura sp. GTD37 TaxID=1778030 RepID=UPI0035BEB8D4
MSTISARCSSARSIPLPRLVPWLLAVPALPLIGYLHALMHDGRPLLGAPCH